MFFGSQQKGNPLNRTRKFMLILVAIVMIAPTSASAQKGGEHSCESQPYLVIANGHSNADLAVAGKLASDDNSALLYVGRDHVPDATRDYLENRFGVKGGHVDLVIVGGKDVVTEGVVQELRDTAPIEHSIRFAGEDRYETAAETADVHGNPIVKVCK